MKFGSNMAVFFLFFGLTLLEALQAGNWLLAGFFFVVGLVFLYADNHRFSSLDKSGKKSDD